MRVANVDYSVDLAECITWQYNGSPNLSALIEYKNAFQLNCKEFLTSWYTDVFNLSSASYFGLIIWAMILSHTNYVQLSAMIGTRSFGFGEYHKNFFESNFALSNFIYKLQPEELRNVLTAQCYNLQSNGSLYDLNRIVNLVFPNHGAYIEVDYNTRGIIYHFPTPLSDEELSIAAYSNILQVPVGTKRKIINGTGE